MQIVQQAIEIYGSNKGHKVSFFFNFGLYLLHYCFLALNVLGGKRKPYAGNPNSGSDLYPHQRESKLVSKNQFFFACIFFIIAIKAFDCIGSNKKPYAVENGDREATVLCFLLYPLHFYVS